MPGIVGIALICTGCNPELGVCVYGSMRFLVVNGYTTYINAQGDVRTKVHYTASAMANSSSAECDEIADCTQFSMEDNANCARAGNPLGTAKEFYKCSTNSIAPRRIVSAGIGFVSVSAACLGVLWARTCKSAAIPIPAGSTIHRL
jgi:hypothetical protein